MGSLFVLICLWLHTALPWAAAPADVLAIERLLDDHPVEALRRAEAALLSAEPGSEAA